MWQRLFSISPDVELRDRFLALECVCGFNWTREAASGANELLGFRIESAVLACAQR